MFSEIADLLTDIPVGFRPYADISDREAWDGLDEEWREKTVKLGEKYLGYEYPSISAVCYTDFFLTGNRDNYERLLMARRYALNALVLAECVEGRGRFINDIINGIFVLCEESAWQLPAHNNYTRNAPPLILPDVTKPVVDIFGCETAAVLAVTYYLLKTVLDDFSPFITKRIKFELEERIFTPYFNSHFWWMGGDGEHVNNWTVWCGQNILLCALLTDQDSMQRKQVIRKVCRSTDYFLEEYGEDGCCEEGAQYYRYSGLCLFNTIEILNGVTHGAFACAYKSEKIKNIAAYIYHAHIEDKYYVNFADCSPIAGRAGVREFLFGGRTGDRQLMAFAAGDFKTSRKESDQKLLLPEENNLYYRLQNGFCMAGIKQYRGDVPVTYKDIFYPSSGLFIARDEHRYLAVKAGDNGDSHNHNDTGSFIVYKDGEPVFIDVGVGTYTKRTFSPERYEIWTMQSAYHNLPVICRMMQKDGEKFAASGTEVHMAEDQCTICMDIAGAYPAEAHILSYRRHAQLIKHKEIVITDEFSIAPEHVVLSLLTHEQPDICEPESRSLKIGTLAQMKIEGGEVLQIESIPIEDERLRTAWGDKVYRILIQAKERKICMTIC